MRDIDTETQKRAVKEAFKEFLEEKWAAFGKWSAAGMAASLFGGFLYFFVKTSGFGAFK